MALKPGTPQAEPALSPSARGALRLLGECVFLCADRRGSLRAERRYQLLVVLALKGVPVERDWLAALFWPERDNATARRNLRKLAFDLQELDWVCGIESERATLAWRVDTDAAAFRHALEAGHTAQALHLYRGPLAPGLDAPDNNTFNAWLRAERAALHERWRSAMLMSLADPAADPAQTGELAQRLLAADALDEESVVAILRAHQRLGQASAAQRVYDAYKTRLAETLGIEPAAHVRALVHVAAPVVRAAAADAPADTLIGRAEELRELLALLGREECRVLTLSGPGGIGKSRLAKAAVARAAPLFADGLWWVPLDDLETLEQVAPRVAQVLGAELAANETPLQAVARCVAGRRVLLVLDNAEQVARLALFIDRLLDLAPALKLLVTSRRRIGAAGEWLLPLAGLAVPPQAIEDAALHGFDAMRLFEARARAARPGFDAQAQGAAIAAIVRALGGLPLAIELAADWVRLLPVTEIQAEIAASLDLLERAEEGSERAEHRSVRATFESSWRLLAPQEKDSLAALAVLCGPFSRTAARAIGGATLPVLGSLADKSLLQHDGAGRFSLHPLIQQFAREKLDAGPGATARARERHAAFFCTAAHSYEAWYSSDQKAAMATLAVEHSDLLAAYRWALAHRRADLVRPVAGALRYFYELGGRLEEGLVVLSEVEQLGADASRATQAALAEAAQSRAALHYRAARFEACLQEGRAAVKASRNAGDAKAKRGAMTMVAGALGKLGDYAGARRYSEQALREAEAAHDGEIIATCVNNLGLIESARGFPQAALPYFERALVLLRAAGDRTGLVAALNNIAVVHINAARPAHALPYLQEGLALADEAGFFVQRSYFLSNLAQVSLELGDRVAASRWAEEGLQSLAAGSDRSSEPACRIVLGRVAQGEGNPAEAQRQLRLAVRSATSMRLRRFMVRAAIAYGAFLIADSAQAEGVRLLACVKASGVANPIDLARTERLLGEARAAMEARAFAQASAQGEQTPFADALAQIGAPAEVTLV